MSGRGAYFKNLYGGRGRGAPARGLPPSKRVKRQYDEAGPTNRIRGTSNTLVQQLRTLEGAQYGAYRDIEGVWAYDGSGPGDSAKVIIDHVQSDPFAPPSKARVRIGHDVARFPRKLFSSSIRRIALCDFLLRRVHDHLRLEARSSFAARGKGSDIVVDTPGQHVLERSAVVINDEGVEARFSVAMPAQGRRIRGNEAAEIFGMRIPALYQNFLYRNQDANLIEEFVESIEDQHTLRSVVGAAGLSAFVANGAVLPRRSGVSDAPLESEQVVRFQSPHNLEKDFTLPNRGLIRGLGIPKGIIVISGGGFHGKSTLLDALSAGCYNHIPGDGREFVVCSDKAVMLQGEDGRSVKNVDISPYINNLPGMSTTQSFSTEDASGSTSMAAGVIEALELGADTILFDEDTCATNFMIRDQRMQRLIASEPITPHIFKARSMFEDHKGSSILVVGGCGDYLDIDIADVVLEMRQYQCYDITIAAKRLTQEMPSNVTASQERHFGAIRPRHLTLASLPGPSLKVSMSTRSTIRYSDQQLDLSAVRQLVHDSQTRAIAAYLKNHARIPCESSSAPLVVILEGLEKAIDAEGLDILEEEGRGHGFAARPRMLEVGMAINRLRSASLQY